MRQTATANMIDVAAAEERVSAEVQEIYAPVELKPPHLLIYLTVPHNRRPPSSSHRLGADNIR